MIIINAVNALVLGCLKESNMSYIDDTLLENETCCYRVKPHWIVFGLSVTLLVFSMVVYFNIIPVFDPIAAINLKGFSLLEWLTGGLILLAVYQGLVAWLMRKSAEYGITDKRILLKKGFIQRDTVELFLDKIEAINIDQTILGRILDYGTVVIVGTGGSRDPFGYVPNPLLFRKKIQQQIDIFRQSNRG